MYDLEVIKNKFGERMAHLCRELFPTILEYPGVLSKILLDHFEPEKSLAEDLQIDDFEYRFKDYIYAIFDKHNRKEQPGQEEIHRPQELLDQAGYILYECQTEEDIQAFKKYYALGEELCTFRGERLKHCHVFFAVKKDVDKIKRENFPSPQRQDEYGTSVISIQFTRDPSHTLSIKNRYNHTVINPDATFSNNLENIIPGLTQSFKNTYGLGLKSGDDNLEIGSYVRANDGKYYKYNLEINNVYYCPNNIIIDNFEVKRYPKDRYLIFDYFILDMNEKKVFLYDQQLRDCFPDTIGDIKKVEVLKNRKERTKRIIFTVTEGEFVSVEIDRQNQVIGYHNLSLQQVGDRFLSKNVCLQALSLPEVREIGDRFLQRNKDLQQLDLPKLQTVGDTFLLWNRKLQEVNLPKLQKVSELFLESNNNLKQLNLPELIEAGDDFFAYNDSLLRVNLPKLQKVGNRFLLRNQVLQELDLPSLQTVKDHFLSGNNTLQKLSLPELREVGDSFLSKCRSLEEVNLPKLQKVSNQFLKFSSIKQLNLPELIEAGDDFVSHNRSLLRVNLPKLQKAGKVFLNLMPGFLITQYYPLESGRVVFSRPSDKVQNQWDPFSGYYLPYEEDEPYHY